MRRLKFTVGCTRMTELEIWYLEPHLLIRGDIIGKLPRLWKDRYYKVIVGARAKIPLRASMTRHVDFLSFNEVVYCSSQMRSKLLL